jgi:arsenical pump membrane protein
MTGAARIPVTLAIFAGMLLLVILRPRNWNEAWWTVLGAAVLLALGLVSPRDALAATLDGKGALLFLLALLFLSMLVGKSGFFEWAAIWCARIARGDARALYRNTFLLGAIITAVLSLDTTAVILTPVVLSLVKRLRLPVMPYVVLSAFVANVASLMLPISNLTNILFADAFHFTFAAFAARMLAPQIVALVTLYFLLRWQFRRELPAHFDAASLPAPASVVPHRPYFIACVVVLGVVLVGYFVAPLVRVEPYAIAFAGGIVLVIAGVVTRRVGGGALLELSWGVFPFVVGLFIAVRGIENLGLVGLSSQWLSRMPPGSLSKLLGAASTSALAANVMNNLPAALIARSVLQSSHAHAGSVLAALVGANAGSIVTPFGSLATMLVITIARREGEHVDVRQMVAFAAWAAPLLVVAATLALALTFVVAR